MSILIRVILSLVLLYFVYQETGPATCLALFLILVVFEILGDTLVKSHGLIREGFLTVDRFKQDKPK